MIYFIYGNNQKKNQKTARGVVDGALKKYPNASLVKFDVEKINKNSLDEIIFSQGLFCPKYIVTLNRVCENDEAWDLIIKNLKDISDTDHLFIWIEEKVKEKDLLKIKKFAQKIEENNVKEFEVKNNPFAISDAIFSGDKKKAWVEYQKAIINSSPEEIHGTIWWVFKSAYLAIFAKNSEEAGMKDFVYQKSKGLKKVYSVEQVKEKLDTLVKIYHESRRGKIDLGLATEKFILGL
jgi:DNA polymerase III delta subunit